MIINKMIIKNKILTIFLFVFAIFSCRQSDPKEARTNNVSVNNIKKDDSLHNFNEISEKECFNKIGCINGDENQVAKFDEFSIEVISKKFKTYVTLKRGQNISTFNTDIILDMGEFYYWAYTSTSKNHIYLLELDNYYSSTFFILMEKDNNLYNLGDISIDQPNAENGLRKESFKFCLFNNKLVVEAFLDLKSEKIKEFEISSDKIAKINEEVNNIICFKLGNLVYPKVETYLNIRSAPNSSGNIVGKAYPKDGLKIIAILDGWLKVKLDDIEGYVSSDFVK